jgi:hypothetical protein
MTQNAGSANITRKSAAERKQLMEKPVPGKYTHFFRDSQTTSMLYPVSGVLSTPPENQGKEILVIVVQQGA